MLGPIIFALLISTVFSSTCPNGTLEYQSNCFFFNGTETGFAAAEISCTQLGGHLVSIHDAFTNVMLGEEGQNNFQKSTETDFWIGANNLISNGKWKWTDGTPFDFNDWKKGEPQNAEGLNCAALSLTDGTWSAQDCFKAKPFVCKVPNIVATTTTSTTTTSAIPLTANCSRNWYYVPQAHACYGTNDDGNHRIDWTKAQEYCDGIGAHLPSIHTLAEFQYLQSMVHAYWLCIWTGIFSVDGGRVWKNSDGTVADFISYGPWCGGHPFTNVTGQICVAMCADCYVDIVCNGAVDTICKKQL